MELDSFVDLLASLSWRLARWAGPAGIPCSNAPLPACRLFSRKFPPAAGAAWRNWLSTARRLQNARWQRPGRPCVNRIHRCLHPVGREKGPRAGSSSGGKHARVQLPSILALSSAGVSGIGGFFDDDSLGRIRDGIFLRGRFLARIGRGRAGGFAVLRLRRLAGRILLTLRLRELGRAQLRKHLERRAREAAPQRRIEMERVLLIFNSVHNVIRNLGASGCV